jgi:16S rRNA processing protein RimM
MRRSPRNQSNNLKKKNEPAAGEQTFETSTPLESWVMVGVVVGVFGIAGEVKVEPTTSFPERFAETPVLYAGPTHTPYRVLAAHPHKRQILLRLEGITDMSAAERLRGATLSVPASEIHSLPDDHFYLHDVIGLRVRHVSGRDLGFVRDVLETGGADLFVIDSLKSGREVLLPAVKAFIKSVDLQAGVVEVDPIPGLFDDDFDTAE